MNDLRIVLRENALFSGVSGIVFIAFHSAVATWFGVEDSAPFWIIGIVLVLFALHVWYESSQVPKRAFPITAIFVMDVLWVLGSISVVALQLWGLTNKGYITIIAAACVVGVFAWFEARGLQPILK